MPRVPGTQGRPVQKILTNIETTDQLKEWIYERFKIDHDPCPLFGHLNGPDGLDRSIPWGKNNYINPPFVLSGIKGFTDRAIEEMEKGNNSYVLIPWRYFCKYYNTLASTCTGIIFFGYPVKFKGYKAGLPQQMALVFYEAGKPTLFQSIDVLGPAIQITN